MARKKKSESEGLDPAWLVKRLSMIEKLSRKHNKLALLCEDIEEDCDTEDDES